MASESADQLRLALTSDEFRDHLAKALAVPADVLSDLVRSSRRRDGFDTTVNENQVAVWLRHSASMNGLAEVLSVLSFLFNRAVAEKVDAEAAADEVVRFAQSIGLKGASERRHILGEAFRVSGEYQKRVLATPYLRHGVPNLRSVSATVGLRGVFDTKESEDPTGLVPVLQIRLTTYEDDDEESEKSFLFQCAPSELDPLIESLSLFRRRIDRLIASTSGLEVIQLTDPSNAEATK